MDSLKKEIYDSLRIDETTINQWTNNNYSAELQASVKIQEIGSWADTIIIIGDYDCDGICGVYTFKYGLKSLFPDKPILTLIPTRTEGYGINNRLVEYCKNAAKDSKVVVITVDTGITAKEQLEDIKAAGCKVILTDHHELSDRQKLPKVDYIVDPSVSYIDNPLVGRNWCGAAVAFKLLENIVTPKTRKHLLPFVGIATVADIITMREGSWQLVRETLDNIGSAPYSLKLLISALGRNITHFDENDIGYYIGPAFNAPGRLYNNGAMQVLDYLENPTESKAQMLVEINNQRKQIRDEEIIKVIDVIKAEQKENNNPIWVYVPGLHKGIVGILAGHIAEKFHTSACVLTNNPDGTYTGSSRSFGDFDMFKYLDSHSENFIKFGGHKGAAGFSMTPNGFKAMEKEITRKKVNTENVQSIPICLTDIPHVNRIMTMLRPFGEGFKEPLYSARIDLNKQPHKMIGKSGEHLSVTSDVPKYRVIHFYHSDNELKNKNEFIAYGNIHNNYFRGCTPELNIKEVKDIETGDLEALRSKESDLSLD